MTRACWGFMLCLLMLSGTWVLAQPADSVRVLKQAKAHIATLASAGMKGRGYVGQGHVKAARYLRKEFPKLTRSGGLKLLPPDTFSFRLNVVTKASLSIGNQSFMAGADFIPAPYTSGIMATLEIADAGYGLPADVHNAAPGGKLAVVREGLPPGHNLPDSTARILQEDLFKLEVLQKAGARAVVLLRTQKLTHAFAQEDLGMPVLQVAAQAWPAALIDGVPHGTTATVNIAVQTQTIVAQNVVTVLPAAAPTDSSIVLCAHYDHLGMLNGQNNHAIFYGANDNASGTAFLLALAERLQASGPFRYNIVLLATAAEEAGLIGSTHYVQHPTYPLAATKFALNFDLMGNGQQGMVAVGGKDFKSLFDGFIQLNQHARVEMPMRARPNAPNSDHWPFTQKGIPALFWYTEGGKPHYHDVYDRPNQLELPAFYNCLNLVSEYLRRAAAAPVKQ